MTGYGWLAWQDLPPEIDGVAFDQYMPTRREEFMLVRNVAVILGQGICFDAGSGVTPDQHVMPIILSANGWVTYAIDSDERTLDMPSPEGVIRRCESMVETSLPDGIADLTCCVSVLEHCDPEVRRQFANEAKRVTRPNGYLVITADEIEPRQLAGLFVDGFETGTERQPEDGFQHLAPRVSYVIARRV